MTDSAVRHAGHGCSARSVGGHIARAGLAISAHQLPPQKRFRPLRDENIFALASRLIGQVKFRVRSANSTTGHETIWLHEKKMGHLPDVEL